MDVRDGYIVCMCMCVADSCHHCAGVDAVQQYGLGQGDQSNESALEQAKDEQISDEIRRQFKQRTGEDIPIEDKKTTFG